jgi:hypothetical protein
VRRVAPDGTVTTLAGGSQKGQVDGCGTDARFDGACGLAIDPQGNVRVVEQSGRVRKISPDGVVTTVAGSGRPAGFQSTFPKTLGRSLVSGFLPADALEASRSDELKKPQAMARGNSTVCHKNTP